MEKNKKVLEYVGFCIYNNSDLLRSQINARVSGKSRSLAFIFVSLI